MTLLLAFILALAAAPAAFADSPTLPASAPLPWSDPNYASPLENLLGPIQSTIANRQVTARCEGDYDWSLLSQTYHFDPGVELGYVEARFYSSGAVYDITGYDELSPRVCSAVQAFAIAATKPTKCSTPTTATTTTTVTRTKRVAYRVRVWKTVGGVRKRVWVTRHKTVTVKIPVTTTTTTPGPLEPCYDASGTMRNAQDAAYWDSYIDYALGILTVAHESIHLGGFVGGVLSNGVVGGYGDAEARAQCFGMQWMPYVAEQLGAAPDDALSIARFTYAHIYPLYQTAYPEYWSAECRAGGALDLHLAGQPSVW